MSVSDAYAAVQTAQSAVTAATATLISAQNALAVALANYSNAGFAASNQNPADGTPPGRK